MKHITNKIAKATEKHGMQIEWKMNNTTLLNQHNQRTIKLDDIAQRIS